MIVSKETTLTNLVQAVRTVIGSRLSMLPNTTIQAVKKSYQDISVQPPYPYIDIEFDKSADNTGNSIRAKYVDVDDVLHIVSEQPYTYKIKCFGKEAVDILTEFKFRLNEDTTLDTFNATVGGSLVLLEDPIFEPTFKETGFVMSAHIFATFMVLHDFTTTTSIVETVETEGEYHHIPLQGDYLNTDPDPDPFSVTFTTDINN